MLSRALALFATAYEHNMSKDLRMHMLSLCRAINAHSGKQHVWNWSSDDATLSLRTAYHQYMHKMHNIDENREKTNDPCTNTYLAPQANAL